MEHSLCLVHAHGSKSSAHFSEFMEETNHGLRSLKLQIHDPSGDFNAQVENDAGVQKGEIGQ